MNKIRVSKNKISNFDNDKVIVEGNTINFNYSGEYEIEYVDCNDIFLIFNINGCNIKLCESSFDNNICIKNTYNVKNGYLVINKFYNNKSVSEELNFNLYECNDRVDYTFSDICLGEEKYLININHKNKKTISNINNRAISLKNSKINFIINSNVIKEGIDSVLNQNTRIVTLDNSDAKICPNMFIDLDDVSAKHGSVIGTFNNEQIFYLMSKGISYYDSLKLLIKGCLLSDLVVVADKKMKILEIIDRYWR